MKRIVSAVVLGVAVIVLVSIVLYISPYGPGTVATSSKVPSDTFLTSCVVTGVGGFELRVVSDSTGAPVSGETISAVDTLGCVIVGYTGETQVVYIHSFSVAGGGGGWLMPVFPDRAIPGGGLNITVAYQGRTFNFTAGVPPVGTACVTLHVPSGNVTMTTAMNGSGSYCA